MAPSQEYSQGEGRGQGIIRSYTDTMQVIGMGENCEVTVSDFSQLTMEQVSSRGTLNPGRGTWGSNSPGTNEQESSRSGIISYAGNMQVIGMGNHSQVRIGYNPTPPYIPPIFQGYNFGHQYSGPTSAPPFPHMPPSSPEYNPEHQYTNPYYRANLWGSSTGHRQQTQMHDVLPPPSQYGADAPYAPPPAAPNPPIPTSKHVTNLEASVSVAATRMSEQPPSAAPHSESSVAGVVTEAVAICLAGPAASKAVTPSSAPPLTSQAEDFSSPSNSNGLSTPAVEPVPELPPPETAANHDSSRLLVQHPQLNTTESIVNEFNAPSYTTNVTPSMTEHVNKDLSPDTEKTLSATGVPELPDNDRITPCRTKKFCRLVTWIIARFKKRPRHVY